MRANIAAAVLSTAFILWSGQPAIAAAPVPRAPTVGKAGFIDIDPRKVAKGLFFGDADGFPITISQPGSYRLIGNLTVPSLDTTAIEITSSQVTLDLNGYTISGPNSCPGCPSSCTGTGSGVGVLAKGQFNVSILNGNVVGMGGTGVQVDEADGGKVEGITAVNNGGAGVVVGPLALVEGCRGSAQQRRRNLRRL